MTPSRWLSRTALAAALGLLSPALHAGENELTPSEQRGGWKLLFDGKSTDGWRNYKKDKISDGWKAENGALVRSGQGAGDIVATEEFDSFELSLEYNISEGGNSGLMFHVSEDGDAPWHSGPEIQVQDNVKGHDPQKAGWLYQLYPALPGFMEKTAPDATRPAGQWNQMQVRITPAQCEINMNGIRYTTFKKGSPDWDEKVAKSKFAKMPKFGKNTKGFICLQDHGNLVSYRNIKVRKLADNGAAPDPVDGKLEVTVEKAFPKLQWEGWEPVSDAGKSQPFRTIFLTHAGDGTNRLFAGEQWGQIFVFKNDQATEKSEVFLDIRKQVQYADNMNEEGLLGAAFHPKFKENGQFYVYYTTKDAEHTSVVSQFTVSKDNPNKADPASEKELLRIPQPFWNHNGGTIAFGPDGMLYIALGDGGAGNDPFRNGQKMDTLLGKILRIDVDHQDAGKAYAIPKDNPFVGQSGAAPEIYALGFRNPWRVSFDTKTGDFWCADVGQNLWEEIDLVEKGGNYGWNFREGLHPFGAIGAPADAKLIDPIWEYDHQVGKSITGGHVYRGDRVKALAGKYLYADYVSGKLYALDYDVKAKKVLGNYSIPAESNLPVMSYGEDEKGDVYFMIVAPDGKGIYRFK
jgi:glucose/arabinose dehydrogenase